MTRGGKKREEEKLTGGFFMSILFSFRDGQRFVVEFDNARNVQFAPWFV